jgi:hypothetical protein
VTQLVKKTAHRSRNTKVEFSVIEASTEPYNELDDSSYTLLL